MKKVTLFTVATMMMFMFAFTSVGFAKPWICMLAPNSKACEKAMKNREKRKELREKGDKDKQPPEDIKCLTNPKACLKK